MGLSRHTPDGKFTSFSGPFCLPLLCIASYFCSLAMHTSTGRKALETRQIYVSGQPLPSGHPSLTLLVTKYESSSHVCLLAYAQTTAWQVQTQTIKSFFLLHEAPTVGARHDQFPK